MNFNFSPIEPVVDRTKQVREWLEQQYAHEVTIEESVRTWNLITPGFWKAKKAKKKKSEAHVWLTSDVLREVAEDARRHNRSISQSLQAAWTIAREKVLAYPGAL